MLEYFLDLYFIFVIIFTSLWYEKKSPQLVVILSPQV